MKVTRDWIFKHKTPAGGWRAKQLAAIGVKWPPTKGWIDRIEGKKISESAAARFEAEAISHKGE